MKKYFAIIGLIISTPLFAANSAKPKVIDVLVTEKGFEPDSINVHSGDVVTLSVTRKTDSTCAKQIQVPSMKIKKDLPLNQTVSIDLGKPDKGEVRFGCGMRMMMGGVVTVN
jgi:plastocyanin domain-containing protein